MQEFSVFIIIEMAFKNIKRLWYAIYYSWHFLVWYLYNYHVTIALDFSTTLFVGMH